MAFALITSAEHRRKHQERPENYEKFAPWRLDKIPANVWLGVTCGPAALRAALGSPVTTTDQRHLQIRVL
jgi:hypothetical protein